MIRNKAWIPGVDEHQVLSLVSNEHLTMVSDLINTQSREWKAELIRDTFLLDVMVKILQVPLASEPHDDFRVCRGKASSVFTMRSAYRILQENRIASLTITE